MIFRKPETLPRKISLDDTNNQQHTAVYNKIPNFSERIDVWWLALCFVISAFPSKHSPRKSNTWSTFSLEVVSTAASLSSYDNVVKAVIVFAFLKATWLTTNDTFLAYICCTSVGIFLMRERVTSPGASLSAGPPPPPSPPPSPPPHPE